MQVTFTHCGLYVEADVDLEDFDVDIVSVEIDDPEEFAGWDTEIDSIREDGIWDAEIFSKAEEIAHELDEGW